jgi:Trypsin
MRGPSRGGQLVGLLLAALGALGAAAPAAGIIAGAPAERGEFPFFARIERSCGAVLVAPDRVLSAGHCRAGLAARPYVRVGPDRIRRRVVLRAQHPLAVRRLGQDPGEAPVPPDLLLLALKRPVPGVEPLAMSPPEGELTAPGTLATTMGYGATRPNGSGGGSFRKGTLEVQDEATCRRVIPEEDERWSICTRDPDGERPFTATCFGDSGGPLVAGLPAEPVLIGIVSFGVRCGSRGGPDSFAASLPGFALDPDPSWAPAAPRPRIEGRPQAGRLIRCEVEWTVAPTRALEYHWAAGRRHRGTRQRPMLRVRRRDVGKRLRCSAGGATRGGFGFTRDSPAVMAHR